MELVAGLWDEHGDSHEAVRVGTAAISRRELLGRALVSAGRVAGARSVVVHATPSLATLEAVTAGLIAGATVVPVGADVGIAERDHILRDSGVQLALGPGPWEATGLEVVPLAGGSGSPIDGRARELSGTSRCVSSEPQGVSSESPALVMYTSGTTGAPKGVALSRPAIVAGLDALYDAWDWNADDHLVHGLPLSHVHGLVLGVLGALRIGCRLTHTARPTPQAYAAAGGSLYFGVPTVWSRVVGDPQSARELSKARLLVSGSAPLAMETFGGLKALSKQEPVERYGMTETLITLSTRAYGERRPGWVGWPLNGVTTRVVTEQKELARPEEIGELHVRGITLFDGYVGRPDLTKAGYTDDGWWRTGDAAYADDEGCHRIVGRLSTDLIKSGGYRIGAGEIEDALLAHPAVAEAAVVGAGDPDLGQRIVAFVVADGVRAEDLVKWVAGQLSVHKRPREVHLVDALPRNSMGKVQKAMLMESFR